MASEAGPPPGTRQAEASIDLAGIAGTRGPHRGRPRVTPRTYEDPSAVERRVRDLYEAHGPTLLHTIAGWTGGDRHAAEDLLRTGPCSCRRWPG